MKSQLIIETNQKTGVSELVDLSDLKTRFDHVQSRPDNVAYGIDEMLMSPAGYSKPTSRSLNLVISGLY